MQITAKIIKGIKYTSFLGRKLKHFPLNDLAIALTKDATFFLDVDDQNKLAVSWWVSAKRTRSYPYARVYDSFGFSGKRLTIIPIMKDEGSKGDRDFLQWDTISLMSLLGIYVIISYYKDASKSDLEGKITKQRFDELQIRKQIDNLLKYQGDALHWNLNQIDDVLSICKKAIESYERISKKLKVSLHSKKLAENRMYKLMENKEIFLKTSRELASRAQLRESIVTHLAESVDGSKSILTISNYLGGNYYFTSDEVRIIGDEVYLVEAKNTRDKTLPSLGDIKDGLLKMILFTNLEQVKVNNEELKHLPLLKLTGNKKGKLTEIDQEVLSILKKEANTNRFKLEFNGKLLE